MIDIQKNISLKNYNTFGIDVKASQFVMLDSITQIPEILEYVSSEKLDFMVLGGGSNVLFTKNFDGLIIYWNSKGKEILHQSDSEVLIKANAGENWHEFVMWSLEQGFSGLENLALIPGNVGSSPIQNIGAYGVEVKDIIDAVEIFDTTTSQTVVFKNTDCNFGYRDSIFKKNKGKYIVSSVTFKLKNNSNQVNTSYGAIESTLSERKITHPKAQDVAEAVIYIRETKLPNPKVLGNSGSFFKNPVISIGLFNEIKKNYPNTPNYPVSDKYVKIPAGWLIEQCGFKGKKFGEVGVHDQQSLVLVNLGNAKGTEVLELANLIQKSVKEKFDINIEMEVNII